MRKYIAIAISLIIMLCTSLTAFGAQNLPNMVDAAHLLTDEQVMELEDELTETSEALQFDIVVVTVDTLDGKTPEAYADDFYDYNGYGYTEDHDGCLLLVSMEDRDWHISTTGYGITALTDAGIDYIADQFLYYLSSGDYYTAFTTFESTVVDFVNQSDNGDPYDIDNLDEYDSSYIIGGSDKDSDADLGKSILVGVIVGAILTLIIMSILKGKMKSVYHKATANEYLIGESLAITGRSDRFVTSHVTKTARESKSSGGGSSTHSGSSGTSHGGGGGKF